MSAHTPGPWQYGKDANLNPCAFVDAADCTGFVVAHTTRIETGHRMRGVTGEQEANARLIAAAPELLEALKMARATLADCGQQDSANWPTFQAAVAAIAKAESA